MDRNPKLFEPEFEYDHDEQRRMSSIPSWISTEITLRDLFAAAALSGITSTKINEAEFRVHGGRNGLLLNYAETAYEMADAMLAERAAR